MKKENKTMSELFPGMLTKSEGCITVHYNEGLSGEVHFESSAVDESVSVSGGFLADLVESASAGEQEEMSVHMVAIRGPDGIVPRTVRVDEVMAWAALFLIPTSPDVPRQSPGYELVEVTVTVNEERGES